MNKLQVQAAQHVRNAIHNEQLLVLTAINYIKLALDEGDEVAPGGRLYSAIRKLDAAFVLSNDAKSWADALGGE